MTRLQGLMTSLRRVASINPFTIVRKSEYEGLYLAMSQMQESLSSIGGDGWFTAAETNVSGDARWKRLKEQAMAAHSADSVVTRILEIYEEHCLAGGIRYSTDSDAGWVTATLRRLFPRGLFQFFGEYLFMWGIMGELYFLPQLDAYRRVIGYKLISPLEVIEVHEDVLDDVLYFRRQWQDERVSRDASQEVIEYETRQRARVYNSNEVVIIKWNSAGHRGIPFVSPLLPWVLIYNEWLKDRAIANRIRGFAYLKRTIKKHGGSAKAIADQFSSQLMKSASYQPMSHTQFGYGYKAEKMPTGGIVTCDDYTDYEPLQFNIQGDDASPDGHAFRQQICARSGIPEALLFTDDKSKLDTASATVESFVRKIEYIRDMFHHHLNSILNHCRRIELLDSENISVRLAGRRVSTDIKLHFKPAAVGERRFVTEDLNKAMSGGQISRQTAREIGPFSADPEEEERRIRAESKDELNTEFLDRIAPMKDNREDEDTDFKKKQKDSDAGIRDKERDQKGKTGAET